MRHGSATLTFHFLTHFLSCNTSLTRRVNHLCGAGILDALSISFYSSSIFQTLCGLATKISNHFRFQKSQSNIWHRKIDQKLLKVSDFSSCEFLLSSFHCVRLIDEVGSLDEFLIMYAFSLLSSSYPYCSCYLRFSSISTSFSYTPTGWRKEVSR